MVGYLHLIGLLSQLIRASTIHILKCFMLCYYYFYFVKAHNFLPFHQYMKIHQIDEFVIYYLSLLNILSRLL